MVAAAGQRGRSVPCLLARKVQRNKDDQVLPSSLPLVQASGEPWLRTTARCHSAGSRHAQGFARTQETTAADAARRAQGGRGGAGAGTIRRARQVAGGAASSEGVVRAHILDGQAGDARRLAVGLQGSRGEACR